MTGLITDTSDQRLIRQSTAAIADRYGHGYYAERPQAAATSPSCGPTRATPACSACT